MKTYFLENAMLFSEDRDCLARSQVVVQSINTGRIWLMDKQNLPKFLSGRRLDFYGIYEKAEKVFKEVAT